MKKTLLILAVAMLAACGSSSGLSGEYTDANGTFEIEFKDAPNAYVTTMGKRLPATYKINGDSVVLTNADGSGVLTMNADGSLAGGPTGVLTKKNK